MTDMEYMKGVIRTLESAYTEMEKSRFLEKPVWVSNTLRYRYERKSDVLLIFLKGVRWVSMLNASVVLLNAGYTQEIGILFRCMDESLEDMLFFAEPHEPNGELSKDQLRAFTEFFQEQIEDPDNIRPIKRDRVPRKKVRAAITPPGKVPAETKGKEAIGLVYDAFSGFIHGAYPHIMDSYGGDSPRYHMSGMLKTPRIEQYERQLTNYVYRAILGAQLVAGRLGEKEISDSLLQIKNEFMGRFPGLFPSGG